MNKSGITKDIRYVGVNDHKIDLFEGQFKVEKGMSYNSYIIMDDKTTVVDSVDRAFAEEWVNNIRLELKGRSVDYLIINHMEPDHSGSILELVKAYPAVLLVGNAMTFKMLDQFFPNNRAHSRLIVKDKDTLVLGHHRLHFITAPNVHWPEVMFTYDETDEALFSADAFGKFGALDIDDEWDKEARRYYFGIVGKYGKNVLTALDKVSNLKLKLICPLHGPVLLTGLEYYIEKYKHWASYEPDQDGVLIAVSSVYGNTMNVAKELQKLLEEDSKRVVVLDLNRTELSTAVSKAFKYNKLVLASITYNQDVFPSMSQFIEALKSRNYQNRTVGFIENGSWAPQAAKVMKESLEGLSGLTLLEPISIKGATYSILDLERLAKELK
ncbi:MAG: FprA family A-type flavoprotein [Acholeplasmatales bacterium]|nr:FprA family A-type flavoprotein [Acholeplasmatales bacterium]